MIENELENLFRKMVKKAGGVIYKLDSRARKGSPDRIVTINGKTTYVELKTETGRLSPLQAHEIESIRQAGGKVRVLYGAKDVKGFVDGSA